MNKYNLKKEETGLVIIDIQERLMKAMDKREQVYKNTALLLQTAKQLEIPVVVTEQYPRGLGVTVPEITAHLPEHRLLEKMSFSAGEALLKELSPQCRNIIISGSETHVCVFQTVRDLVAAGYNVQVAQDAVCSRYEVNYKSGLELMRELGAVISNTETIVFDLLKISGTTDFKAISPLLK